LKKSVSAGAIFSSEAFCRISVQRACRSSGAAVAAGASATAGDFDPGGNDGGFGEGAWTREGKRWNIDVHGVRPDGRKLTATFVYIPADPTTLTWQAVNQSVDGVPIADTQPIKVTKQNPAKTTAADSVARPGTRSL